MTEKLPFWPDTPPMLKAEDIHEIRLNRLDFTPQIAVDQGFDNIYISVNRQGWEVLRYMVLELHDAVREERDPEKPWAIRKEFISGRHDVRLTLQMSPKGTMNPADLLRQEIAHARANLLQSMRREQSLVHLLLETLPVVRWKRNKVKGASQKKAKELFERISATLTRYGQTL